MTWLNDPKTSKGSVTLTLLMISFVAFLGGNVAETLGYIKSTASLNEMFYTMSAMYFGRRLKKAGPIENLE